MFTTIVVGTVTLKTAARTAYRGGKATTAIDLYVSVDRDGKEVKVVVWGGAAVSADRYLELGHTISVEGKARAKPVSEHRAILEVHTKHVEVHGRAIVPPRFLDEALNEGDGVYRP